MAGAGGFIENAALMHTVAPSSPVKRLASKKRNRSGSVLSQSEYATVEILHTVLSEDGMDVGHFKRRNGSTNHFPDKFHSAVNSLQVAAKRLVHDYGAEIRSLVKSMDKSDIQLCSNFHAVADRTISPELRWGRVVSLVTFTGLLMAELCREGQLEKVESVYHWLLAFVTDHIFDWIQQQGGWSSAADSLNTEKLKDSHCSEKGREQSWVALAALGVGAIVVGALISR